jgi:hypothetical protein
MSVLFADITAPYTAIEAWTYDRFIAPAVADLDGTPGIVLEGIKRVAAQAAGRRKGRV